MYMQYFKYEAPVVTNILKKLSKNHEVKTMAKNYAYDKVTAFLIEKIKTNKVLPWKKTWKSYKGESIPRNQITGNMYMGTNVFTLNFIHFSNVTL